MSKQITGKSIAKNISLSVLVQAVSLVVGFVMNLIVPKYIDEYQYSYWQTFLLYSQYVGFFHFGLLDGIVLRYSQYDYDELDKKAVRSQYLAIICIDAFISLILFISAFIFFSGINKIIVILLSIIIIPSITYNYVSFTFQTTNRISKYARYIMLDRCLYCGIVVACLLFNLKKAYWYCIAYIISQIISILIFGMKYSRELFFGKMLPTIELRINLSKTIGAGVWLMIASYSANLVVGLGKMIVQWRWDELTFGKVSLSFSLTTFVLHFVTAISVVLFPSIKRLDSDRLPDLYKSIRDGISPLLLLVLIFYFPGSYLLKLWLPKYVASIVYLGILLPIIVYSSKVSLLTNNYLKAYRKEKTLLVINILSVVFGFVVYLILTYVFNNLFVLLFSIVGIIMIRSIVSEIAVMKIINVKILFDIILEVIITSIFIVCAVFFSRTIGFFMYAIAIIIYFCIKRRSIANLLLIAKKYKK
ncbi:MAG: hypothetical protein WBI55_05525 [Eubacteriales bacterium]